MLWVPFLQGFETSNAGSQAPIWLNHSLQSVPGRSLLCHRARSHSPRQTLWLAVVVLIDIALLFYLRVGHLCTFFYEMSSHMFIHFVRLFFSLSSVYTLDTVPFSDTGSSCLGLNSMFCQQKIIISMKSVSFFSWWVK